MTISFEPVGVNGGGMRDSQPREYFDVNTRPGSGRLEWVYLFVTRLPCGCANSWNDVEAVFAQKQMFIAL
jgi:hypothetical protein